MKMQLDYEEYQCPYCNKKYKTWEEAKACVKNHKHKKVIPEYIRCIDKVILLDVAMMEKASREEEVMDRENLEDAKLLGKRAAKLTVGDINMDDFL